MAKEVTREQAERKKSQATEFMERIGDPDRAEQFDDMSIEEYAEHRGLRLSNPNRKRKTTMANGTSGSKADLQDQIDEAIDVLDDAYAPESNREELAEAVGKALDILRAEEEGADDEGDIDED